MSSSGYQEAEARDMAITGRAGASRRRIFWAAAAACLAWNGAWWLQPQLLSFAIDRFAVAEGEAGLLVSVETGTIAVVSILVARILGRFSAYKFLVAAAGLALAGDISSLFSPTLPVLVATRFVAGIGEGIALTLSNALLADYDEPDRAYAKLNFINILYGAALIECLPLVAPVGGQNTVFIVLLGVAVLCAPVMLLVPRSTVLAEVADSSTPRQRGRLIAFALLCVSLLSWTIASSGLYALEVELGKPTGLSEDSINTILSIATLISLLGTGLVSVMGTRFGRVVPTILGIIVAGAACFLLTRSANPTEFAVATCLSLTAVYYLFPFYLGQSAAWDSSGRFPALVASVFLAGGAIAPFLTGNVAEHLGFSMLGDVCAALVALSAVIFVLANRIAGARGQHSPTAQVAGVTAK